MNAEGVSSRAQFATAVVFLLTRVGVRHLGGADPAIQAELGLAESQLGVVFVGLNAGAILGLQLGAAVVARVGSRRSLLIAMPAFAVLLIGPAAAPNLAVLTTAVLLSAAAAWST
jgi:MFS family permease